MSADDSFEQSPFSVLAVLTVRYPQWTIWFGQATRHWWALRPRDRDVDDVIEAPDVKELVDSIEAIQVRRGNTSRPPGGILFGEAETSRIRRVPAAAWPGGIVR